MKQVIQAAAWKKHEWIYLSETLLCSWEMRQIYLVRFWVFAVCFVSDTKFQFIYSSVFIFATCNILTASLSFVQFLLLWCSELNTESKCSLAQLITFLKNCIHLSNDCALCIPRGFVSTFIFSKWCWRWIVRFPSVVLVSTLYITANCDSVF